MQFPIFNRWLTLGISLLIEVIGGLSFMLYAYSDQVKSNQWKTEEVANGTLSQNQIDWVTMTAIFGGNIGIHIGIISDKFGPQITLLIAGVLGCGSWMLMWSMVYFHQIIWYYWLLLLAAFFQGHSQQWSDIAVISTVIYSFTQHRGLTIGICKSLVSISGLMATEIYITLFKFNISGFILFLAILVAIVCAIGTCFLQKESYMKAVLLERLDKLDNERQIVKNRLRCVMILIGILSIEVGVPLLFLEIKHLYKYIFLCLMIVIFLSIFIFLIKHNDNTRIAGISIGMKDQLNTEKLIIYPETDTELYTSLRESVMTLDFLIIWFSFMVAGGSSLVIINNITLIEQAIDGSKDIADTLIYLSIANCFGPIISGSMSDWALARSNGNIPRPIFYGVACLMIFLSHLLLLFQTMITLYISITLTGLAYGALHCLTPIIISEKFGITNVGAMYGTVATGLAIGAFVLPKWMTSYFYNKHAVHNRCIGYNCFAYTNMICASLCLIAFILQMLLSYRSRFRYRQIYSTAD